MGVLQAFERRLGGLVEGAFAKVFKGDVQPVEIAGALQREADARKSVVGQGRVLVPNEYAVELGAHDFGRIEEWAEPLSDELAAMVREHAADAGYSFVGPVQVTFELHDDVGTGVFHVRSAVMPAEGAAVPSAPAAPVPAAPSITIPPAAVPTPPIPAAVPVTPAPATPVPAAAAARGPRPAPAGAYPLRPRVIVSIGGDESAFFLSHPVTVIGRAAESDLRIDDPGVSRRHAELRYVEGTVVLVDLGSTNGLTVNAKPATRATLRDGDRIDIATSTLIFRRDED